MCFSYTCVCFEYEQGFLRKQAAKIKSKLRKNMPGAPKRNGRVVRRYERGGLKTRHEDSMLHELWEASKKNKVQYSLQYSRNRIMAVAKLPRTYSLRDILRKDQEEEELPPPMELPKMPLWKIKPKLESEMLLNVTLLEGDRLRRDASLDVFCRRELKLGPKTFKKIREKHYLVCQAFNIKQRGPKASASNPGYSKIFPCLIPHSFVTKLMAIRNKIKDKIKLEFRWFHHKRIFRLETAARQRALEAAKHQYAKKLQVRLEKVKEKQNAIQKVMRKALSTGRSDGENTDEDDDDETEEEPKFSSESDYGPDDITVVSIMMSRISMLCVMDPNHFLGAIACGDALLAPRQATMSSYELTLCDCFSLAVSRSILVAFFRYCGTVLAPSQYWFEWISSNQVQIYPTLEEREKTSFRMRNRLPARAGTSTRPCKTNDDTKVNVNRMPHDTEKCTWAMRMLSVGGKIQFCGINMSRKSQ
eukprot:jgi/Bigna1/80795/fgenesh1_pg.74_\